MRAIRTCVVPLLGVLVVLILAPGQALAARAFSESGSFDGTESPARSFEGACGVAVDSFGDIYVADYYHHVVDVYSPGHRYMTQLNLPHANGPCGLAVDSSGHLFVDVYHEAVTRYTPSSYPPSGGTTYGAATVIDTAHPTGVAIDPASGELYVDERTAVEVFDPTGSPLRRIELAPGADAYGVAVSDAAANEGDVYVADAATDEVEAYGPAGPLVGRISGAGDPRGGFVTLADAALTVDQTSGDVLVAEDTEPGFEAPAAAVEEFDPTGDYLGQLSHPLIDAVPSGLATTAAGGVYVGSGNGPGASVLAFGATAPEPLFRTSDTTAGEGTVGPQAPADAESQTSSPETLGVSANAGLLRVTTPGPGVVTVDGPELTALRHRVGVGRISLRPQLDRGGVRALERAGGLLRVLVHLRFEPTGGGVALVAHTLMTFSRPTDERKR
jgi:hypothetical protein